MTTPAIPLDEFDQEMRSTRTLLTRVPMEKGSWKPHEKSFPLGHLALLVAWIPGWITRTLREPKLDLTGSAGYRFVSSDELLAELDRNVGEARAALETVNGPALREPWSLTMGDRVLMTKPRGEVVRQHIGHLSHHRGQLTVYLRLLDVPLPSIYGPTADERW